MSALAFGPVAWRTDTHSDSAPFASMLASDARWSAQWHAKQPRKQLHSQVQTCSLAAEGSNCSKTEARRNVEGEQTG